MGSTLETAIVISAVITIIVFLILAPLDMCGECFDSAITGKKELDHQLSDTDIIGAYKINDTTGSTTSPETLCTFLTGISENYRLIYGAVAGVTDEEG